MFTRQKNDAEIEAMRQGGAMLRSVLNYLQDTITAGMSGNDINTAAANELKKLGGEPAFLNYHGFPAVICISVNEVVQHGIPSRNEIQRGDDVNLDFGVRFKGMVTDAGITVTVDSEQSRLANKTLEALNAGLDVLKHGVRVGDISSAVEKVGEDNGFGIIRDLVGHGVGHELHEDPNIPNYGTAGTGPVLKEGMTIAIEPMFTLGGHRLSMDSDGWTLRTIDGSRSAQFEHTVLITNEGFEILT